MMSFSVKNILMFLACLVSFSSVKICLKGMRKGGLRTRKEFDISNLRGRMEGYFYGVQASGESDLDVKNFEKIISEEANELVSEAICWDDRGQGTFFSRLIAKFHCRLIPEGFFKLMLDKKYGDNVRKNFASSFFHRGSLVPGAKVSFMSLLLHRLCLFFDNKEEKEKNLNFSIRTIKEIFDIDEDLFIRSFEEEVYIGSFCKIRDRYGNTVYLGSFIDSNEGNCFELVAAMPILDMCYAKIVEEVYKYAPNRIKCALYKLKVLEIEETDPDWVIENKENYKKFLEGLGVFDEMERLKFANKFDEGNKVYISMPSCENNIEVSKLLLRVL